LKGTHDRWIKRESENSEYNTKNWKQLLPLFSPPVSRRLWIQYKELKVGISVPAFLGGLPRNTIQRIESVILSLYLLIKSYTRIQYKELKDPKLLCYESKWRIVNTIQRIESYWCKIPACPLPAWNTIQRIESCNYLVFFVKLTYPVEYNTKNWKSVPKRRQACWGGVQNTIQRIESLLGFNAYWAVYLERIQYKELKAKKQR